MKKYFVLLIMFLFPIMFVDAKTTTTEVTSTKARDVVTLENCSDISQIWFNKNGKVIRVGLLAYDPGDTSLNNEIQNTICNKLKEAKTIELEKDSNNKKKDKYNRDLMWIYIDGSLLQKELIAEGLGMVNYVEENYSNIDYLCVLEANAIKDKKGIWINGAEEKYCDSGIILEKQEKEKNNSNDKKKLNITSIIIICVVIVSSMILGLLFILGVIHEKK